jgi:pimeloyl-ACP methyl ester carboxylesterase
MTSAVERPDNSAELPGRSATVQVAELTRRLEQSIPMPLRPQDIELLQGAERFHFGPENSRVAWRIGQGPLVLLVHGWGGRGTQMAGIAHMLASEDYQCIFFDAGGHGDSRAEPVGFGTFIDDTGALTRHVQKDVHAWIGHSAGGLGMMSARSLRGLRAQRYVCIAAPLYPYIPLQTLKKNTGARDEVLDQIKPYLSRQFDSTWEKLRTGETYAPESDGQLLLIYDKDDERTRHEDADAIAAVWPGAIIKKTTGYGHNRVLQAPEAWQSIREFLTR